MNMQAQAQKMLRDITQKQEEIYNKTYKGESEWIEVTITGKKEIKSIKIKYDGDLNEDKEMLEDMLTLALKNAFNNVDKDINDKLGMYSNMLGGLM